ncbi:MAG: copper-translocating P-type ATPase [Saprospiraceae bacterium]|nr:copper-translocating P-type ATPase [Saprospiraceae bacterium]
MKHTYRIIGTVSQDQAEEIRRLLQNIHGIRSVEVHHPPDTLSLEMHHHVDTAILNQTIKDAGEVWLEMDGAGNGSHAGHTHHGVMDGGDQQVRDHANHHDLQAQHGDMDGRDQPQHGHASHHDHGAHHGDMIDDFRKRFWVSLLLTAPIVLLSPMIQHWLGIDLSFTGDKYVLFVLSSVVYFYGGWPFLQGLFEELKSRAPGMMTLIAMAISVAYFYSAATVFGLPGMDFFWELATLIVIMLLGHWIEMRSVLGASRALELLVSMMPSEAHRVEGDEVVDVPLREVVVGDVLVVKPGEKVPADGIVTEGESYLNEAMLTGESKPARKQRGDQVIGGSINGNGVIRIKVEHTGEDSYLNKVITMVREAQGTKSRMQNLSNRAARWLTYIALAAGVTTLTVWLALGSEFVYALERMVTVMVISCPHALGLAVPLVVAISTTVSAQQGLLIRNRTAFEESRKISALVFDKTGTLTEGKFGVSRVSVLDASLTEDQLLRYAGALEQSSEHPIAVGIMNEVRDRNISIPQQQNFEAITGTGVKAMVDGKDLMIVSPGYLRDQKINVPDDAFGSAAETVVFVLIEGQLAGYVALSDAIRPESAKAIETFRQHQIKVYMATGDNEMVGKAVSEELGLDGYYAEVLPHEKVEIVKELQGQQHFVAMTGDGVNDAPALAQADVGIAIGSGTDVAAETADIILVNSNPRDIANLILFGKATYRKMIQNLAWATGYNAIAIPLAAGVLSPLGFVLSPAIGAVLMSLSTVIVAINAQLLKKKIS